MRPSLLYIVSSHFMGFDSQIASVWTLFENCLIQLSWIAKDQFLKLIFVLSVANHLYNMSYVCRDNSVKIDFGYNCTILRSLEEVILKRLKGLQAL